MALSPRASRLEAALSDGAARARKRLRAAWLPLLQVSGAAAIAWFVAHNVLGHPEPFFAPVAAILALSVSIGQRGRRAVEMMVGVVVGILIADLVMAVAGNGVWQIGVAVGLSMTAAVILGGGVMLVNQAGASAAIVLALGASEAGHRADLRRGHRRRHRAHRQPDPLPAEATRESSCRPGARRSTACGTASPRCTGAHRGGRPSHRLGPEDGRADPRQARQALGGPAARGRDRPDISGPPTGHPDRRPLLRGGDRRRPARQRHADPDPRHGPSRRRRRRAAGMAPGRDPAARRRDDEADRGRVLGARSGSRGERLPRRPPSRRSGPRRATARATTTGGSAGSPSTSRRRRRHAPGHRHGAAGGADLDLGGLARRRRRPGDRRDADGAGRPRPTAVTSSTEGAAAEGLAVGVACRGDQPASAYREIVGGGLV